MILIPTHSDSSSLQLLISKRTIKLLTYLTRRHQMIELFFYKINKKRRWWNENNP